MMLSARSECAAFSCLPDRIMDIPHPGMLEAYTSGKILTLHLQAEAKLQMCSLIKFLDVSVLVLISIRSKHCFLWC